MKFKLLLKNNEAGEDQIVYFDTDDCSIKYEDGRCFVEQFGRFEINGLDQMDTKIAIQMGFECNLGCPYCFQKQYRDGVVHQVPEFTEEEIQDAADAINDNPQYQFIDYWGGEPLMYLDVVKRIEKLVFRTDKRLRRILTNGILLDLDTAKWLMENNFELVFSHDAQAQHRRGKEVFDDPKVVEAVTWLINNHKDRFGIASTLLPENMIYEDRINFFKSKLPDVETFDGLYTPSSGPLNKQKNNPLLRKELDLVNVLYKDMSEGMGTNWEYNYRFITNTILRIFNRDKPNELEMDRGFNSHKDRYIHSLDGKPLDVHGPLSPEEIAATDSRCGVCPLQRTCQRGCIPTGPGAEMSKETCRAKFLVHYAQFKMVISSITRYEYDLLGIDRITPVDQPGALEELKERGLI